MAAATALFGLTTRFQPFMWLGVALLAAALVLHVRAQGGLTGLWRGPLALFVLGGLVGLWAAYDRSVAAPKLLLLLASVALYYVLAAYAGQRRLALAAIVALSLLGAGVGLFFVTQSGPGAQAAKFGLIARWLGLAQQSPQIPFDPPHANRVAGILATVLPLSAAAVWSLRRSGHGAERATAMLCGACVAVMAFVLLMTSSRGAWLALGIALLLVIGWTLRPRLGRRGSLAAGAAVTALAVPLALAAAGGAPLARLDLFEQAAGLLRDYPLTGAGLGVFPMVFSTYALLINVYFVPHAHNLFIQVWLEQGLLGFAGFVGLIALAYAAVWRQRDRLTWLAGGAALSLTVILAHGLVDAVLYSNRVLPLMFVPLGLLAAGLGGPGGQRAGAADPGAGRRRRIYMALAAVLAVPLVLLALRLPAVLAANAGSVAQARLELAQYVWPTRLIEQIRRETDLSPAESYFQQALAADPGNVTANQRLAAIALARRQFSEAEAYAQRALASSSQDRVTWRLLGDAYLGLGRLDEAFAYWVHVDDAATQLELEAELRFQAVGDGQRAEWARSLARRVSDTRGER